MRRRTRARWPARSRFCASVAPRWPGAIAIVLVTFAATAGRPSAVRVGKVMSVPPPARALTAPAATAASPARPQVERREGRGLHVRPPR